MAGILLEKIFGKRRVRAHAVISTQFRSLRGAALRAAVNFEDWVGAARERPSGVLCPSRAVSLAEPPWPRDPWENAPKSPNEASALERCGCPCPCPPELVEAAKFPACAAAWVGPASARWKGRLRPASGVGGLALVGGVAGAAGVGAAVGALAVAALFGGFGGETKIGTEAPDGGVAWGWLSSVGEFASCRAAAGWVAEEPGKAGPACAIAPKAGAFAGEAGEAEVDKTPSVPEAEREAGAASPAEARADASADGALIAEEETGFVGAPARGGWAPACGLAASAGFAAPAAAPSGTAVGVGVGRAGAVSEVGPSVWGIAGSGLATGALAGAEEEEEEEDEGPSAPEGKGAGGALSPGEEGMADAPIGSAAIAEKATKFVPAPLPGREVTACGGATLAPGGTAAALEDEGSGSAPDACEASVEGKGDGGGEGSKTGKAEIAEVKAGSPSACFFISFGKISFGRASSVGAVLLASFNGFCWDGPAFSAADAGTSAGCKKVNGSEAEAEETAASPLLAALICKPGVESAWPSAEAKFPSPLKLALTANTSASPPARTGVNAAGAAPTESSADIGFADGESPEETGTTFSGISLLPPPLANASRGPMIGACIPPLRAFPGSLPDAIFAEQNRVGAAIFAVPSPACGRRNRAFTTVWYWHDFCFLRWMPPRRPICRRGMIKRRFACLSLARWTRRSAACLRNPARLPIFQTMSRTRRRWDTKVWERPL